MKKQWIIAIIIILVTVVILTACGEKTTPEQEALQTVTKKLRSTTFPITVTSKMTIGQEVYNGEYVANRANGTFTAVYSYEQAAKITIGEDGKIVMPESAIETKTGNLTIKNGNIVEENGAACNLPISLFQTQQMTLDEDYLTDVVIGDGMISAKVIDAGKALGFAAEATNVSVNVTCTDTAVKNMTIAYNAGNVRVELNYKFGK